MSGKGAKGLSGKGLSGKGAKGTMKGGDKKKPTSRSVKAGLQFPVGRIHRFLKVRPETAPYPSPNTPDIADTPLIGCIDDAIHRRAGVLPPSIAR
jgi:hypothetical protein